jgi:hypothetical protein
MVSGVEVTESKFVEGMDDDVKVTATSTTFTLSKSLSSSSSTKKNVQRRPVSKADDEDDFAREVLSPLYSSRKVKSRIKATAKRCDLHHGSKRRESRGLSTSYLSPSEECLFDECSTATDSPMNVRRCVSSSAVTRAYAEVPAMGYRKYQSLTWSPTNIRASSSLFSDFAGDSRRIEDEQIENSETTVPVGMHEPITIAEETNSPAGGVFTWSPSAIRSPLLEPSRQSEVGTYPLSRDPIITFSVSSDQGSHSRGPSSVEQRDPHDEIRCGYDNEDIRETGSVQGARNADPVTQSTSAKCEYRRSESMEDLLYVIPPEDNPSFEWSPPASGILSPPISAITDETSEMSIPRQVIVKHAVSNDEAAEVQSVSDIVKPEPGSVPINDFITCYSKGVRQLSKSVGDGATLSDDNLIIRFGEWAAKNPFLGACSPHPGDWDSLQSSSCTDVESSVFSSCCSSTEDAINLDALIREVMDKRLEQQQRARANTVSSISDILGEFKGDDEPALLGYSADDEDSGRFGVRLRGNMVMELPTPKSGFSEFTHTTTLEIGPTTIRTNDLHALTVIMGKWAQTVAREALTPTMATIRQLAMEQSTPTSSNLTFRAPLLPEIPSTPAESTVACVNESAQQDSWSGIVFVEKESTSSICTESGATPGDCRDIVFMEKEATSSLETEIGIKAFDSADVTLEDENAPLQLTAESRPIPMDECDGNDGCVCASTVDRDDDSLALSDGSSSLWFADYLIEPVKPSTDSSTVLSSEGGASLVHDEKHRAVIMLSDSSDESSLLFPSFTLSSALSTVESDDGLHEELGALDEVREELRKELENASFIMQSIYPPTKSNDGAKETGDGDIQEVMLSDAISDVHRSERTQETSTSSGSVRRVRFSSIVEEFVFIKEARSPSEDSCETFGSFLSSRLENIFCAVRDMVDEWECGTNTSDDYQYPMPPPTPPHPHPSDVVLPNSPQPSTTSEAASTDASGVLIT